MKKSLFLATIFLFIFSCEIKKNDFFPLVEGMQWVYSLKISSSYTGKSYNKRIMVTNYGVKKNKKSLEVSKLYSDGSFYTYEIEENQLKRTSVIIAFSDGIVEPVKKIIYPDLFFNQQKWMVKEQLFLVKGFQPPLLNVKPRSQFEMTYMVNKKYKTFIENGQSFKNCIEIVGNGSTNFIGDTRSGPIKVNIKNLEILCDGVGLVKQVRSENTEASAFGNMTLTKKLLSLN